MGEPNTKKARTVKDSKKDQDTDDKDDLLLKAWSHFKSFLGFQEEEKEDDETDDGADGGDVNELLEILELLKETKQNGISFNTREGLLPVLMSACHTALAEHKIGEMLEFQQEMQPIDKDGEEMVKEFKATISSHLKSSLDHFPDNAAALFATANFVRNATTLTEAKTVELAQVYVKTADLASKLRSDAISILEDKNVDEETKEWIEGLLLDQVTDVNPAIDADIDDEAEEFDEKGEFVQHKPSITLWSSSSIEGTARYTAAMLLSMTGNHREAKEQLLKFSQLTHRLHPNIWQKSIEAGSVEAKPVVRDGTDYEKDPVIFQALPGSSSGGVLPDKLYQQMCQIFRPDSPYWKESDYAQRGYYSYFSDLPAEKGSSKPINLIEDVVVNHLLPLAKTRTQEKIVGYEWWIHTRPIAHHLGHNLHFDTDEARLLAEGEATHPILSSVLYLTGGGDSGGGATIVLDQTPESESNAEKAWINAPKDNTLLVFPGNLLHGVLPCTGGSHETGNKSVNRDKSKQDIHSFLLEELNSTLTSVDKQHEQSLNRLTFMVGFWTRCVPDGMKQQRLYGPCGKLPPTDDPDLPATWVKDITRSYNMNGVEKHLDSISPNPSIKAVSLQRVTPAWEELRKADELDPVGQPCLEIPTELDHQFFVENAPLCFLERMFSQGAAQFMMSVEEDDEDSEDDIDNDRSDLEE